MNPDTEDVILHFANKKYLRRMYLENQELRKAKAMCYENVTLL